MTGTLSSCRGRLSSLSVIVSCTLDLSGNTKRLYNSCCVCFSMWRVFCIGSRIKNLSFGLTCRIKKGEESTMSSQTEGRLDNLEITVDGIKEETTVIRHDLQQMMKLMGGGPNNQGVVLKGVATL